MVTEIDIFAHQIVEITHFVIDLIVPAFAGVVIDDFEDAILIGVFDVVDAAKAFVIPDELRILSGAGREGVAGPGFALDDLIIDLCAILFVHTLNANVLFLIGAHFVVNHHVQQHRDVITFERINGFQKLGFITVFGGNTAFLVKLAEIKQIVRIIPDRVTARCAFIGWRQPDHIDADFVKIGG